MPERERSRPLRRALPNHSPLRHRVQAKPEPMVELPRIPACTIKLILLKAEHNCEHEVPNSQALPLHKHLRKRNLSITKALLSNLNVSMDKNIKIVMATPERKLFLSPEVEARYNKTEKIGLSKFTSGSLGSPSPDRGG